jgi:endonuclease/exonuclease/phosphatase family metal-dependent hydrolase
VRSFRRGVDAAAKAFSGGDALDLLFVQECGPRPVLARFADELGMSFASSHRRFGRVRNAVLYRPPWRAAHAETSELSRKSGSPARGYVAAHLRTESAEVVGVSAHLGLRPREREAHARELTDALLGAPAPILLGVDLNEGPEGPAARWLAGRLFDAHAAKRNGPGPTYPAPEPTARIDFLFASEGLEIRSAAVLSRARIGNASDHLPVVAEFELSE